MDEEELSAYVVEVERRFRDRTPSNDILSALPDYRVGRSEMRTWFTERFGRDMDLDDTISLAEPLRKLFVRLRKEFPLEAW